MAKKAAFEFGGSNELSRLLTRERLKRAGVDVADAGADPELDELFQRVRSSTAKKQSNAPAVPADVIRKLVGG